MKKTGKRKLFDKILALVILAGLILGVNGGCGRQAEPASVRVGGLKGPTTMGLVFLQEWSAQGQTSHAYTFTMAAAAEELLSLLVKEELDIALLPANVASVLYNKTEGGVTVIDINTLGVLYLVSGDREITGPGDLRGRTVYLTGKGTTPYYVLQYLLRANGIDPSACVLEYRSEAAEVAALLEQHPQALGLLPQPFATAACAQNQALDIVMDLNEQWNLVQGEEGHSMVTGVTLVRNGFLQEYPEAVETFLQDHAASVTAIREDPDSGARLVAAAGIVAGESVAREALPYCNITYMEGHEMRQALAGYLQVLFEQDPLAVGGALPGDDFYYIP